MWFIVLAVIIYVFYKICESGDDSSSKNSSNPTNPTQIPYPFHYYGGFDDISVKEYGYVDVYLKYDVLNFKFHKKGLEDISKNFKYENVIKVKFMNEISISKEVSLGKMICFGWLSLAMKDEKKNIKEYLVIDIKNNDETISVILDCAIILGTNQEMFKTINSKLNQHQ